MRRVTWCAVLVMAAELIASAGDAQPVITNARAVTTAVRGSLASTVQGVMDASPGPQWIGWAQPAAVPLRSCCGDDACRGCRLEPVGSRTSTAAVTSDCGAASLKLEGDTTIVVLVRAEGRRIDQLRTVGASCPLDGGGLPFTTITGVTTADTLAWLRASIDVTDPAPGRRHSESAVHVIGRLADPGAVPMLFDLARRHADTKVRGAALMALAQVAGRQAGPEIRAAIDTDPDTEVKKRAVFALSQLPKDQGVPLLIDVARSHQITEVRRRAMFWLGQSNDARAIEFFATVLNK